MNKFYLSPYYVPGIVTAEHTYGVVVGPGPGKLARPRAWLVHRDKLRAGGSRVGPG